MLDAGVHTSVVEDCRTVPRKTLMHNDYGACEHALKMTSGKYPLLLLIIDGIYHRTVT